MTETLSGARDELLDRAFIGGTTVTNCRRPYGTPNHGAPRRLPWGRGLAPLAAVSYSKNDRHDGRIYRFDGWTKVTDRAGSSGGGQWSRKREKNDAANGPKTLWVWRYE